MIWVTSVDITRGEGGGLEDSVCVRDVTCIGRDFQIKLRTFPFRACVIIYAVPYDGAQY